MPSAFAYLLTLFSGYVIGSVSFAVLIAKNHGVDIFKLGSGNPGATNILRNLGKKAGYTCFLLDAFKGIAAALVGRGLATLSPGVDAEVVTVIGLAAAIFGHSYSVFLGFRGGKGVATTVGGLLVIMPVVMLIGIVVWLVTFYSSRYVSLASILLGISLPISAAFLSSRTGLIVSLILAVLLVVRHRSNIQRLLNGTENRATRKR
jgi:glycerol-3-phosphate acyltransferase PlsY